MEIDDSRDDGRPAQEFCVTLSIKQELSSSQFVEIECISKLDAAFLEFFVDSVVVPINLDSS